MAAELMDNMSADQRSMLIAEAMHASIVMIILTVSLIAYLITPGQPTLGLLSSAVGGGLIYAHARASAVRSYMRRNGAVHELPEGD